MQELAPLRAGSEPLDWKGSDRFEVIRCIGRGGMGAVYEARDRETQHVVALKTILHFTPVAFYLFKQEFRTLADVRHRNLVRLYELIASDPDPVFFSMELVRGTDFLTYVHRPATAVTGAAPVSRVAAWADDPTIPVEGAPACDGAALGLGGKRPSPAEIDRLRPALRQLVEGVQALHARRKLHRDIKPSNVLVTPEGRVVILDFGVATDLPRYADDSRHEDGQMVGTAKYMAPEQAFGEDPTPAADWYSVGVVLYEALVGTPPFGGSVMEVISLKCNLDAPPPSESVTGIPADLDALCRQLLDRSPDRRPNGPEILRRLEGGRVSHPAHRPSIRASAGTSPVGRERELGLLHAAFSVVRDGEPTTVRVHGRGGIGKSTLVNTFLDNLAASGEAVVLRGRVYEQESLPYKAVDSLIDSLSRHLLHVEDTEGAVVLPRDIWALARLFPVLSRVQGIAEAVAKPGVEPQLVRRLAFAALRELLATLSERRPIVLCIDDVQWGDTDSAALLLDLVRPPNAPPMLLLLSYREEHAEHAPFLLALNASWPCAPARDVAVGPLDPEEAQRLALSLLDARDERARGTAAAISRESCGSPLLVEELARSSARKLAAGGTALALEQVNLDRMVAERLTDLPQLARRITEIVAVAGRPLAVTTVCEAAAVDNADDWMTVLETKRFLHSRSRDGREVVEVVHDRIRETIVAQLKEGTLRGHHLRLANALEASGAADPEAIATHLISAGERERASLFAERAAEQASKQLAFDQAERLFRLTLETGIHDAEARRRLRVRLAQVLEWSARNEQAAREYLAAADGAPPLERAELVRGSAVGLFASGRLSEGAAVLRQAMLAVGVKTPQTLFGAILWLIAYRLWLTAWALLDVPFVERTPAEIPRAQRARVDAMFGASMGFALTDVVLGSCFAARSVVVALRHGDSFQVMRAALLEANHLASAAGSPGRVERRLMAIAESLAQKDVNQNTPAFFKGDLGISLYLRGQWKNAFALLEEASALGRFHDLQSGWRTNGEVFACWALKSLGEYRQLAQRHARLLADADAVGDRFMSVHLRGGSLAIVWLVSDDPHGARGTVTEAMEQWPKDRYLVQHWHQLIGEAEIELYAGDGAKAYDRLERDAAALRRSLLLQVQVMRIQTAFMRGRAAIASLDQVRSNRGERLAEARRMARGIEKEGAAWSTAFSSILGAAVANAEGDLSSAVAKLRSAVQQAQEADMAGYAAAINYRLGALLGGSAGHALVSDAETTMRQQGIRRPDRFAAMLVPGRWEGRADVLPITHR